MTTLDDLTNNIATLTTEDAAERAAIDALVTLVTTLKTGVGTLTAAQVDALDKANAALANITAVDIDSTAAINAAFPAGPPVTPAEIVQPTVPAPTLA